MSLVPVSQGKIPSTLTPPTIRHSESNINSSMKQVASDGNLNRVGLEAKSFDNISIKSSSSASSLLNLASYPLPVSTSLLRYEGS